MVVVRHRKLILPWEAEGITKVAWREVGLRKGPPHSLSPAVVWHADVTHDMVK